MTTRELTFFLAMVMIGAGCEGPEDASNNNNGPLPKPGVDHLIESVTVDASENTITVSGIFRPTESYAEECAPYGLGTSEIVHVIALYPDAEDYRPGVWQYTDATPISAEEFEARAEAARLNEFDVPIQWIGVDHVQTYSVSDFRMEGMEHLYSGTRGTSVGIFYANGTSAGVDHFCGACGERGVCGDAWCDEGEAGCWQDCPEPLEAVCGDGWCAASEFTECPQDCTNLP